MIKIRHIELGEFPLLLAPMEDVSDPPFRYICKLFGADLTYTEFISSEGLIRDAAKSVKKLDFTEFERPIGIQIVGYNIDSMVRAAKYAEEADPDLIDINFGCPVKKVVAKGAGAGILKDIPKMIRMTEAVVKATRKPVTVKTRLGWDENSKNIVEVAAQLQDTGIAALAIHGRTRAQLYKGTADWTLIGEVKNNPRITIPIIGNGDIDGPAKAMEMKNKYGVDGIMIGRGSYGNPWIFRDIKHFMDTGELFPSPDISERVKVCMMHLEKSVSWKGERTGILEMRKHYSGYFKGYHNFKAFRIRLMNALTERDVIEILEEIRRAYES